MKYIIFGLLVFLVSCAPVVDPPAPIDPTPPTPVVETPLLHGSWVGYLRFENIDQFENVEVQFIGARLTITQLDMTITGQLRFDTGEVFNVSGIQRGTVAILEAFCDDVKVLSLVGPVESGIFSGNYDAITLIIIEDGTFRFSFVGGQ